MKKKNSRDRPCNPNQSKSNFFTNNPNEEINRKMKLDRKDLIGLVWVVVAGNHQVERKMIRVFFQFHNTLILSIINRTSNTFLAAMN